MDAKKESLQSGVINPEQSPSMRMPAESAQSVGLDPIETFLQKQENQDYLQDIKRCLGGDRRDLINALLLINRPASTVSEAESQLSQEIMNRLRSQATSHSEDFWLSLKGTEGREECAGQRQVLLDVESALFPIHSKSASDLE